MGSCIAILHSWTMTKWWQHQSDHSTSSNCVISARWGWVFSHTESMAKTIESEPEQFKHQNSVLLYPNTEDHKNQAFRYLRQYIILCDLCYVVTFLNSSMPQKPVRSVKTFFLCEHPVYKTRIYFRQEWLVYVMRMHSMWYVQTYLSKRLLNYYLPPWPIPYVQLRGPTRCHHI